ncbi:MAG TPA: hypothetical protein VF335_04840 [Chitinivibrionales bacterium]
MNKPQHNFIQNSKTAQFGLFLYCMGFMALSSVPLSGQTPLDSLYFSFPMRKEPQCLLSSNKAEDMRNILAGPVLMDGPSLMFYSRSGYVLFSMTGAVLDSHSVFKDNKKLSPDNPGRLMLAYPVDSKTLLYCRREGDSLFVYEKKIYRKGLFRVIGPPYSNLLDIEVTRLFNVANNTVIDETASKSFLLPNLVGFTSLAKGKKWWTLDKFYSFMSPVICMDDQAFNSFYPGLLSDQKTDVQKSIINPLGTFCSDGRWSYFGVHSSTCSTEPESHQVLYLCDQAGNLLFTTQLLKQVVTDDVLDYDKKRNTNYTVKRPAQFVCQPANDENGNLFYGTIDFDVRTIEVRKRVFFHYSPRLIEQSPDDEDRVGLQRRFTYKPVSVACKEPDKTPSLETGFTMRDEQGKRRKATMKDVSCKRFCVMVRREPIADMKKRFSQMSVVLPPYVKHVRDSLAKVATASCPYNVTLYYDEREKIRSFYYGVGDEVLSARVLAVTAKTEIFVRVDLKDRAEILVFLQDGAFLNRFTFNRQDFKKRKDIIAVSDDQTIVEEDYERIKEDYSYFKWELSTAIAPQIIAWDEKKK